MPIYLASIHPRWPLPVAPDADLRTRFTAALQAAVQLHAAFEALRSTIMFTLWIVQEADAAEPGLPEALDRLAQYLARRWQVRDERAKVELMLRARDSGVSPMMVKTTVLMSAMWFVLHGDINDPHFVRFGTGDWLVDDAGRKLPIAPDNLPFPRPFRWAVNRIIKTAEAMLLDESVASYEATRARPDDLPPVERLSLDAMHAKWLVDADADPLYALMERESAEGAATLYATVERHATPAQRSLLAAIYVQLEAGGSMKDGAITAAAKSLGISAGTARAQLHRLRATLSPSMIAATSHNLGDSA